VEAQQDDARSPILDIPEPAIGLSVVRATASAWELGTGDDAQVLLGLQRYNQQVLMVELLRWCSQGEIQRRSDGLDSDDQAVQTWPRTAAGERSTCEVRTLFRPGALLARTALCQPYVLLSS